MYFNDNKEFIYLSRSTQKDLEQKWGSIIIISNEQLYNRMKAEYMYLCTKIRIKRLIVIGRYGN